MTDWIVLNTPRVSGIQLVKRVSNSNTLRVPLFLPLCVPLSVSRSRLPPCAVPCPAVALFYLLVVPLDFCSQSTGVCALGSLEVKLYPMGGAWRAASASRCMNGPLRHCDGDDQAIIGEGALSALVDFLDLVRAPK